METTPSFQNDENQLSQRRILKATHSKQYKEKLELSRNTPSNLNPNGKAYINFENLDAIRVLGEGAFGEVVLVVDRVDPTFSAAVKRIGLIGIDEEQRKQIKKEALLHRLVCNHPNIVNYYTMRAVDNVLIELFLEYVDGGELFDCIEPDVGMGNIKAQFYFIQLLNGLKYIHDKGISHRDIKPENLLLNKNGVLKISDFGMATVFRNGDVERTLTTRCGTLPYAAPEVLEGSYKGEAIDVWSAGVVLVTMLVGELPWEFPTMESPQYSSFINKQGYMDQRPWCRMDTTELSLLRLVLCQDPIKRGTISRIQKHPWVTAKLEEEGVKIRKQVCNPGIAVHKRPCMRDLKINGLLVASQPVKMPSVLLNTTKVCNTGIALSKRPCMASQPSKMPSILLNMANISETLPE